MGYNVEDVADKIIDTIKQTNNDMPKLNIMVLGKTGVGKSTLINNVFSHNLATVGVGKPVTDEVRKYEIEGFPLAIYDTPGTELGGVNGIDKRIKDITQHISKGVTEANRSGKIDEAIHCIWYCVSTASHRFEEAEKDFIQKFLGETAKYNVPVIVVLTQSYSKKDAKELKNVIEAENLNVAQVVPVLAQDYVIDDEYTAKAYGLDVLVEVMNNVIPDAIRETLASVQKANLKLKVTKAHAIVAASASAAAATGAMPIPIADSAVLIPEQIAMLSNITAVFGLPVSKAAISTMLSSTIGTAGATLLGKTIVTNILKCIPGYGSAAGGAISGTVAAAITAALGEAYIAIMTLVYKGEMDINDMSTDKGRGVMETIFKEKLGIKRKDNGEEDV